MTQEQALEILKSGQNVFLTGIAGAGKTYVLNQFIQHLFDTKISVGITASTGIVATAINGTTIHSFSGLGIRERVTDHDVEKIMWNIEAFNRIKQIKVLVIDEISMLSAEQLDGVDKIFKQVRFNFSPFGGVQVVFCGDFLQLPPVKGRYAFKSNIWDNMDLQICYLDKSFRQKEGNLLTLLNAIRSGKVSDEVKKILEPYKGRKIEKSVNLFTHNIDVDALNMKELQKIQSISHYYPMSFEGKQKIIDSIKKSCLSPEILELKLGAKVIVTKNIPDLGVVNGTMAVVTAFERYQVGIETFDGKDIFLGKHDWLSYDESDEVVARISQIPLRLAYAITIHKSQGMTLDAATMDLSKTFIEGQGYVAFSRLRSLEGLSLMGSVSDKAFQVDLTALDYEGRMSI